MKRLSRSQLAAVAGFLLLYTIVSVVGRPSFALTAFSVSTGTASWLVAIAMMLWAAFSNQGRTRALESAPPWTPPRQVCLESLNPFLISVLPRRGARATIVARAVDTCDGQYVMVTVGKLTTDVKDECVLQSAVVAALPRGQANATRMVSRGLARSQRGPDVVPARV